MKIIVYFFFIFLSYLNAQMKDYAIKPNNLKVKTYMNIKILDAKEIHFPDKNNLAFTEISDLAYKNKKLFAVGDKGVLYIMGILIDKDTITKLKLISAARLKDESGKKLRKKYRDSEGLVFVDDKLAISFEGKERIDLYDFNGVKIKNLQIHKKLKNEKDYQGNNKGLEAVAFSKKYGIITAPEKPLKNKKIRTVYAKDKVWKFKAEGSISGMEFISKNKLLILFRDFSYVTRERITTLVELNLKNSQTKVIVKMDSYKGWKLDNFEGLTRVEKNKFLMMSDDNDSLFQKTLLVLFEIVD